MKPLATLALAAAAAAQAPVSPAAAVPGVAHLRLDPASSAAERGSVLLSELGCTACHGGAGALAVPPREAPDLRAIGARASAHWLRRWLTAPQECTPGTAMPDVLHDLDAAAKAGAVEDLVHFLAGRGGPLPPARQGAWGGEIERGGALYRSVGCAACHDPDGRDGAGSMPLGDLASKTTVDALAAFLLDPAKVRPAGRMPDLRLSPEDAIAIALWLLREQLDNPLAAAAPRALRPGLAYDYFEVSIERFADFAAAEPQASGVVDAITIDVDGRRDDEWVLCYRGELLVPASGTWRFETRSDDGSRLAIDGAVVVDNDEVHEARTAAGEVELAAGSHAFALDVFEYRGGEQLAVFWEGPGTPRAKIPASALRTDGGAPMVPLGLEPFAADAERARRGAALFARRCAVCHEDGAAAAPPLAALDPNAPGGCLDEAPAAGAPRYALTAVEDAELRAALASPPPAEPASAVRRGLAALGCLQCHARGGVGGPGDARHALFGYRAEVDLGDEGRLPPALDGAGGKLRKDALRAIVTRGELHARARFMATRMPTYDAAAVEPLLAALTAADLPSAPSAAPAFSEAAVAAGRRLVGQGGFQCIICHDVNGNAATAIRGVDLVTATERLRPEWFRAYLREPWRLRPGTRMPGFWPGERSAFTDVCGGDSARQIDAVWSYLSLGTSLPPPKGIVARGTAKMELVPVEEPIVHRTFLAEVGPRAIVVGHPENVHAAFDQNQVMLARLWRGRFFDQSGVASGRTDTFLPPLGTDVLAVPGPAVAVLADPAAPWPTLEPHGRRAGGRFRGYRLDADRRPVFRYEVGGVAVEERLEPVLRPGGAVVRRILELRAARAVPGVAFLAWAGARIEDRGGGYLIDGAVTVTLSHAARVRDGGGRLELIADVPLDGGSARIEEVIAW